MTVVTGVMSKTVLGENAVSFDEVINTLLTMNVQPLQEVD
jgi:hypothetical protein